MTESLLIEIGCEELPARHVQPLAEALAGAVHKGLVSRGVDCGDARALSTPRRLAVVVVDVALRQPDQVQVRKGPRLAAAYRDGAPTKAAEGFARSCGVALADLQQEEDYLVYRAELPGQPTQALLPAIFDEAVAAMAQAVPRQMHWDDSDIGFPRPVRWLTALFGSEAVALTAFGLQATRDTVGHRFHAPEAIKLAHADDYQAALSDAFVRVDSDARATTIRADVEAAAAALGGHARITPELLAEVTALVEWPVAVTGRIAPEYMALPAEVIVTTVETNQRYFTVFDAEGALLPAFITIANIASRDPQQVIAGNERVVRPRLADALFFWDQDRRQPLEAFLPKLEQATFQQQLGSVRARVDRITALASELAGALGADAGLAARAAMLCKADLATQMVFEFPELQGCMGGHYARAGGEAEAVATAIAGHYQPVGGGAPIPADALGRLLALADKLDVLAGIFAVGQAPTASRDPFALRRAAIGVLRILMEGDLRIDLDDWLKRALALQPVDCDRDGLHEQLHNFVFERLRGLLAERGIGRELFDAAAAVGGGVVTDLVARAEAVQSFSALPEAAQLTAAHKRARNVLRQAGALPDTEPDPARFEDASESALADTLATLAVRQQALVASGAYTEALQALAALQAPVDAFFDNVMVMADDAALRANRLALLQRLDATCRQVADLSLLPG